MKLHSIFRPISSHLSTPKAYRLQYLAYTTSTIEEQNIFDEVITLLNTENLIEPALDRILPFLNPGVVSSVLREQLNPQLGFRFFLWAIQRERLCSRESENLMIERLCRDNLFHLFWQAIEQAKNLGVSIGSNAFLVLINAYAKTGDAEKAVESFGKMKEFGCKPSVFTYNAILYVLFRKEVFLLALAIYNQMLKSHSWPNRATFCILIDGLCKCGKTKDALKMFDEMTKKEILPNRITYTIVISGLCHAKRADDALRLFNKMRDDGFPPDRIACNALIDGFCKIGRVDEALALLRTFAKDGFVLGLHGYSSLIDGLFRARRFDEAFAWYRRVFVQGIKPDIVLYTIMIHGLSETGKVKEAMRLLYEMTERGVVPDTYCYNALIKGFCDIGILDKARSLKLEISKQDCFPNSCTYTILISGMCRNGLVGEAQEIFSEMEKIGCNPSVVTFNALIDGLCKAGELEKAHHQFYKMEIGKNPSLFLRLSQGASRVLDSAGLQNMVQEWCESGFVLKAYKVLMQLGDIVVPDVITYNILINGFCKAGNINGAFKLLKELRFKGLSPDIVTYGTLIDGLYRVDREKEALELFEQMEKDGCTPDCSVYRALMTWSCRKKKVSVAFYLWLKYLKSVSGRDDKTIKTVEEHFKEGKVEMAVRHLLEMDLKLKDFDLAPYTIWLIGLCQDGRVEQAFEIFSILEEHKVTVTPPSCVMLIESLCDRGDLDLAEWIFLYTLDKGFMLTRRIRYKLLKSLLNSKDKSRVVYFLSRMKSAGYNLKPYRHIIPTSLLHGLWNILELEDASPG